MLLNLIGLEGSGFVIAIGLVLLVAGLIVYYVNSRIKSQQVEIDNHSAILSQLLLEAHHRVQSGGDTSDGLATTEAIHAAELGMSNDHNEPNVDHNVNASHHLIPVSDSDLTDDSDSDEVSDNEEDNVINLIPNHDNDHKDNNKLEDIKVIATTVEVDNDVLPTVIAAPAPMHSVELSTWGDDSSNSDEDSSDDEDNTKINVSSHDNLEGLTNIDTLTSISALAYEKVSNQVEEEANHINNIKNMRVAELRDLAISKKNISSDKAKHLKKPALIELLLQS